jgi:hypothetical protein
MNKIIAALVLALPGFAFAGGIADGIYNCGMSLPNSGGIQTYVTVNGLPDGRAIWAIPAVFGGQLWSGYGIGAISGSTFSGYTNIGGSFNFTYAPGTFTGTAQMQISTTIYTASMGCTKIW